MTSLASPASRSRPSSRSTTAVPRARASADDPAGRIAALFDEHCGFVCRVLRHHGVHEAALDDAVQDVFVTAHRRWASFEGRSSARSWLYGIARRIAFRYRRSADARARRFVPSGDEAVEGIDEPFARAHAAHSLAALLRELDVDKRTVFVLAELEGMTAPEIAEALGIPLGTAYSRLRAAWQVLGQRAGRERQRLRGALPAMREPDPPPERRRHMWSLVAGGLGSPVEGGVMAAASGWLAQVKWIVVGAALGAGLLGARAAMVASHRTGDARERGEASESAKGSRAGERPAAAAVVDTEADVARPPRTSQPGVDLEPTAARAAAPALPRPAAPTEAPATPVPSRAPSVPSSSTSSSDAPVAGPEQDSLTAELALLQRAREALREGRADDALAWLDRHAEQFPRGQLVDERRALELEAGRPETP